MYAEVAWVIVSSGTQTGTEQILDIDEKPVSKYYVHINGYLHCTNPLFFKFHVKWLIPLAVVRLF